MVCSLLPDIGCDSEVETLTALKEMLLDSEAEFECSFSNESRTEIKYKKSDTGIPEEKKSCSYR